MSGTTGTGLFKALSKAWDIPDGEESLIERAIGAAVLDKIRGFSGTLSGSYKALGGQNPITLPVLSAIDTEFVGFDLTPAAKAIGPIGGKGAVSADFSTSFAESDIPSQELSLVERTIGAAYLAAMRGEYKELTSVYASFGGSNSISIHAFQAVSPLWKKVDVATVLKQVEVAETT